MKALILTLALTLSAYSLVLSQGKKSVVIGTMIDKPNAILVINPPNGDQGFLLPQLTTTQRLSIAPSSPQDDGLMVYDITDKSFYYWGSNAWVKGLGNNVNQTLSYDAATQTLSLSDGGQVNLNTLKEIPTPAPADAGKFLTTDGTTLSWATLGSLGDITSIVAGQGLTGGGTAGDITLSLSTDGSTIGFTVTDQLQLLNDAVSSSKIVDGAVTKTKILGEGNDKVLTTNGAGAVTWEDRSSFNDDNQGLTLAAGNMLNIDNGLPADLNGLTAGGQVQGTLNNLSLVDGTITPAKIQPAVADDRILMTIGGTVAWVDKSTIPLAINVDGATITGDGSGGNPLSVGVITGVDNISDGSVLNADLANNSVDTDKIIDGSITNADILDETVTTFDIANETIISGDILDGTIATSDLGDRQVSTLKIQPGAANHVLITNAAGTDAEWVDQSTLVQNIAVSAPTLTGNGTAGNPLAVGTISTSNIPDNTIETLDLVDDAVDVNKLADNSVNTDKVIDGSITTVDLLNETILSGDILDGTISTSDLGDRQVSPVKILPGAANHVLVTNAAGTDAEWVDQSTLVQNIAVSAPTITGNGTAGSPLAVGTISSSNIPNNTIETTDLVDDAVDGNKLADASVSTNHIVGNAVSLDKIVAGTANQVLVTDGAGNDPIWVDQNTLVPNIAVSAPTLTGNGTAGSPLAVGTISTSNIPNNTIETADLVDHAVDGNKLADASVSTNHIVGNAVSLDKIVAGAANQVLVTDGAGNDPIWVDQSALVPNIAVSAPTLTGNGTVGNPLAVGTISTSNIPNNTIETTDLVDDAVTVDKILQGAPNQVLITNGTGDTEWTDQNNLVANIAVSAPTITGNGTAGNPLAVGTITGAANITDGSVLHTDLAPDAVESANILDGTIGTADLGNAVVDGNKLANGSVSSNHIVNNQVTLDKIVAGTANQVLVTDGTGTDPVWVDQNTLVPNIAVSSPTLTGNGTSGNPLAVGTITGAANITDGSVLNADLADDAVDVNKLADNAVTSNNIINETITGSDIQDGSVTANELGADAVTTAKIANGNVTLPKIQSGAANQVLVTDAGLSVQWVNQSSLTNVATDGATISGNGTLATPLQVAAINGSHITDGTVDNADIAGNAVTTAKILDETVSGADIQDGSVAANDLGANSVVTAKILNGNVTLPKLEAGTANQVLITDGGLTVDWVDQSTLTNVATDGATITGNGTLATPLQVAAINGSHITDGTVDNVDIAGNAVTTAKILDETVSGADIQDGSVAANDLGANSVVTAKILNGNVTLPKLEAGTANQVLITDGGLNVDWVDQSLLTNVTTDGATITGNGTLATPLQVAAINGSHITDGTIQTADLADDAVDVNKLADNSVGSLSIINETITSSDILDETISGADIQDGSIAANDLGANSVVTAKIVNGNVTLPKLEAGTANQVLVTDGGLNVDWVDQSTLTNVATDGATLTGNGAVATPLQVSAINGSHITDGTVQNADIADAAITTLKINDDAITTPKIDDNAVTTTQILDGTVVANDLAVNSVTTAKILNGNVTLPKLETGTANQVLVTDAGLSVDWVDQTTLMNVITDAATITGNGTLATPLKVAAINGSHITDGTIQTADIQDDAIDVNKLADNSVNSNNIINETITTNDILNGTIAPGDIASGGNSKVLTTTGVGAVGWTDQSALATAGDVTGTLAATTVTRIQNRNVSNTAPTNGQTLVWNNATSTWVPGPVAVSPTQNFYSIDPSAFQPLVSSNSNENLSGLFEANTAFVTPAGEAREIIAPVNLPDGATIDEVTAYYVDNELTNMRISIERKPFVGATDEIGFFTTGLLTVVVQASIVPIPVVAERTVDNSLYTYRIHVVFNSLLDVNTALLALSRIHAIRITYTK